MNSTETISGKWLMTTEGNTFMIPKIPILEFQNDEIVQYNFDKQLNRFKFSILENKLFVDDKFWGNISIVSNRLFMKSNSASVEYVKLISTENSFSRKEIESKSYYLERNAEKIKIDFNVELEKLEMLERLNRKRGRKIRLKKIDSTYFLTFTENGLLEIVFPISKIKADSFEIYGFPNEPYFAIAKAI